jgi:hypothetical protein
MVFAVIRGLPSDVPPMYVDVQLHSARMQLKHSLLATNSDIAKVYGHVFASIKTCKGRAYVKFPSLSLFRLTTASTSYNI